MDFFEAQARARKRTTRLVVLFVFAVLATIVAGYFAAIYLVRVHDDWTQVHYRDGTSSVEMDGHLIQFYPHRAIYYEQKDGTRIDAELARPIEPWQPDILAYVADGVLAVVASFSIGKWLIFRQGGLAVAKMAGGRRVNFNSTDLAERRLLDVVEEMAVASSMPVPAVYLLDDEQAINSFAAGLTTADAVVTVSRGAIDKLTRDELQGVVGHEFSHILNGDMRLNLKLGAILYGLLAAGMIGSGLFRSMRTMVRIAVEENIPQNLRTARSILVFIFFPIFFASVFLVLMAYFFVGLILMIAGFIGYFFGRLVQAAVSRQREFLADAASIQFTRNPAGIGGALKKIGGDELGSSLDSNQADEISHFFFAQAFTSPSFAAFWNTHPPLEQRIRAIDPRWDGKFVKPPKRVDDVHPPRARELASVPAAPLHPFQFSPHNPQSAMASIGTLTAAAITGAQDLLDGLPPPLLAAARDPQQAPALIYGLLLNADATVRDQQRSIVAARAGADPIHLLDALAPAIDALEPGHKFSLVQLASPALHQLPPTALALFFDTLDQLIHVHGQVDTFEFALQKILRRNLALCRQPTGIGQQIFSFTALAREINVVLGALAHASSDDGQAAAAAFTAGASQLKILGLLEGKLSLLSPDACGAKQLDAALDRLALAALPIKQRLITAAAHIVSADGVILIGEAELLRAFSAALDVPMPSLLKG